MLKKKSSLIIAIVLSLIVGVAWQRRLTSYFGNSAIVSAVTEQFAFPEVN